MPSKRLIESFHRSLDSRCLPSPAGAEIAEQVDVVVRREDVAGEVLHIACEVLFATEGGKAGSCSYTFTVSSTGTPGT